MVCTQSGGLYANKEMIQKYRHMQYGAGEVMNGKKELYLIDTAQVIIKRSGHQMLQTNDYRQNVISKCTLLLNSCPTGNLCVAGDVPFVRRIYHCLSVCLSVSVSICLNLCLSICLFVCLFVCLSVSSFVS